MKKNFFALMMAMVMVLSLAACGGSDEADSNSGDSAGGESSGSSAFKVGVIGPLTGGAAIYGTCVANSAQIAVDEINALGGDIQFELMTEDDVNDAETSVNAYNALMDDGMQILVGTVTTQPALSVVPLSYEDRVFTLTPSASGDDVISINDNDNVFQICFTDSTRAPVPPSTSMRTSTVRRSPSSTKTMTNTPSVSGTTSRQRPIPAVWTSSMRAPSPRPARPTSTSSWLVPSPPAPICCSCRSTIPPPLSF